MFANYVIVKLLLGFVSGADVAREVNKERGGSWEGRLRTRQKSADKMNASLERHH